VNESAVDDYVDCSDYGCDQGEHDSGNGSEIEPDVAENEISDDHAPQQSSNSSSLKYNIACSSSSSLSRKRNIEEINESSAFYCGDCADQGIDQVEDKSDADIVHNDGKCDGNSINLKNPLYGKRIRVGPPNNMVDEINLNIIDGDYAPQQFSSSPSASLSSSSSSSKEHASNTPITKEQFSSSSAIGTKTRANRTTRSNTEPRKSPTPTSGSCNQTEENEDNQSDEATGTNTRAIRTMRSNKEPRKSSPTPTSSSCNRARENEDDQSDEESDSSQQKGNTGNGILYIHTICTWIHIDIHLYRYT
jgi:hypothetical protein